MMDFEETSLSPVSLTSPRDLLGSKRKHIVIVRTKTELPRVVNNALKHSDHIRLPVERVTSDYSHDSNVVSAKHMERTKGTDKRKDAARRSLLGSIYMKHNTVKRSFSFVAGEQLKGDIKLPGVFQVDSERNTVNYVHKKKQNTRTRARLKETAAKEEVEPTHQQLKIHKTATRRKSSETRLTLPDIVLDLNLENTFGPNLRAHEQHDMMTVSNDSDNEDRALGASYEKILSRPKIINKHNPYLAKHRPITPGLLNTLNALRVPSKVKTEQWINSVADTRKSYQCGNAYHAGNLDNANLAFPNWIYTDT